MLKKLLSSKYTAVACLGVLVVGLAAYLALVPAKKTWENRKLEVTQVIFNELVKQAPTPQLAQQVSECIALELIAEATRANCTVEGPIEEEMTKCLKGNQAVYESIVKQVAPTCIQLVMLNQIQNP
jgi:hypothetical protein